MKLISKLSKECTPARTLCFAMLFAVLGVTLAPFPQADEKPLIPCSEQFKEEGVRMHIIKESMVFGISTIALVFGPVGIGGSIGGSSSELTYRSQFKTMNVLFELRQDGGIYYGNFIQDLEEILDRELSVDEIKQIKNELIKMDEDGRLCALDNHQPLLGIHGTLWTYPVLKKRAVQILLKK